MIHPSQVQIFVHMYQGKCLNFEIVLHHNAFILMSEILQFNLLGLLKGWGQICQIKLTLQFQRSWESVSKLINSEQTWIAVGQLSDSGSYILRTHTHLF